MRLFSVKKSFKSGLTRLNRQQHSAAKRLDGCYSKENRRRKYKVAISIS